MCEHKSFSCRELRKWEGGNVIVDLHKLFLIEYPPSYINIYANNKQASKQTNPKAKQTNQPTQTNKNTHKENNKHKKKIKQKFLD